MRRIALPLSLLLALAACGPEPSEQSDTITIEFWTRYTGLYNTKTNVRYFVFTKGELSGLE